MTETERAALRGGRALLAVLGAAAIAFACLILIWPAPFAATTETSTTTTRGATTTTVSQKKTTSPSNTLVGGILGLGALSLLAAGLFDRLQELKGPGGVGLVLRQPPTPSKEDTEKLVGLSLERWRQRVGDDPTPEEAAQVAAQALTAAQARLWGMTTFADAGVGMGRFASVDFEQARLSGDQLEAAADEAVQLQMGERFRESG